MLKGKNRIFHLKSIIRQFCSCHFYSTLFWRFLPILSARNGNTKYSDWKGSSITTQLIDNMILYIGNPSIYQETIGTVKGAQRVMEYTIKMQKSFAFLYTNNPKMKLKNFTITKKVH